MFKIESTYTTGNPAISFFSFPVDDEAKNKKMEEFVKSWDSDRPGEQRTIFISLIKMKIFI